MALWAVPLALVAGVVLSAFIPWWAAVPTGLLIGAAVAWWRHSTADERLASALGGTVIDEDTSPRLANLVQGGCLNLGMDEPEVRLVRSSAVNAGVSGSREHGVVYVTEGAVARLGLVELEALVAQQLVRLRRGDGQVAAAVYSFLTTVGLSNLAPKFFPDHADLSADLDAVGATKYPPALATVLDEAQRTAEGAGGTLAKVNFVWMAPPPGISAQSTSTATRIAVLREL